MSWCLTAIAIAPARSLPQPVVSETYDEIVFIDPTPTMTRLLSLPQDSDTLRRQREASGLASDAAASAPEAPSSSAAAAAAAAAAATSGQMDVSDVTTEPAASASDATAPVSTAAVPTTSTTTAVPTAAASSAAPTAISAPGPSVQSFYVPSAPSRPVAAGAAVSQFYSVFDEQPDLRTIAAARAFVKREVESTCATVSCFGLCGWEAYADSSGGVCAHLCVT